MLKKLISVLLCLALVTGLGTTAFAGYGYPGYTSVLDITDEDYLREDFHSVNDYGYLFGFGEPGTWEIYDDSEKTATWPDDLQVLQPGGNRVPYWYPPYNVTSISLPKSLVILDGSFETYSLEGYKYLTHVNFEELTELKYIGGYFQSTPLQTIDLRNTQVVRIAGAGTFGNNDKLLQFYASPTLRRIDSGVFRGCPELGYIELNEGLEYIGSDNFGDYTFVTYNGIRWIHIPSTVTYIGERGLPTRYITKYGRNGEHEYSVAKYIVYKGTYAEEWCKANGVVYEYETDPYTHEILNPPYNEREPAPELENAVQIGDLLFTNVVEWDTDYMQYQTFDPETGNFVSSDPVVNSYYIVLNPGACVQTTEDGSSLIYDYNGNKNYYRDSSMVEELMDEYVRPYVTEKVGDGYAKGLTWKFEGDFGGIYDHSYYMDLFDIFVRNADGEESVEYHIRVDLNATAEPEPEPNVTPEPEPAPAPETLTVNPTASKVLVNGVEVKFDAYKINDNNYFKLRDLAMALNGSEKQFDVRWDEILQLIAIGAEMPYTAVGGELVPGDGSSRTAVRNDLVIDLYINYGVEAMEVTAYKINGNNYVKLRDVGRYLDFGVAWNAAEQIIEIDTSKTYDPEA